MNKVAVKAAIAAAALVVASVALGASYRGIVPVTMGGNPACRDVPGLSFSSQVRFSPALNGASAGGVHIFVDGNTVSWYTLGDVLVKAAIVKGGTNANVYRYQGSDFSDGTLLPPLNSKTGTVYDLGGVTFCY